MLEAEPSAITALESNQMSLSPVVDNNPTLRSSFDVDDAFSEGDDSDISFGRDFTAAAIRAELAKTLANEQNSGSVTDASVSTLDINGPEQPASVAPDMSTRTSSYQSCHSFGTLEDPSSSEFSQVSLSDEVLEESTTPEEVESYPTVHIDISEDNAPARVEEIKVTEPTEDSPPISPSPSPPSSAPYSKSESSRPQSPPNSAPPSNYGRPDVTPTIAAITPSLSASGTYKPDSSKLGHRVTRSAGPSALDKVINKTRPTFLPPKTRVEDQKHLADWEHMMKQSRVVGKSIRKCSFQL